MSEDGEIDVESDGVPDGFEVSGTIRRRHVSMVRLPLIACYPRVPLFIAFAGWTFG